MSQQEVFPHGFPQFMLNKTNVAISNLLCFLYIGFKCIHLNHLLAQSHMLI